MSNNGLNGYVKNGFLKNGVLEVEVRSKTEVELWTEAFNKGSDARVMGIPLGSDPYSRNSILTQAWRQGWHDVDMHWGEWARWPVKKLPEVVD